MALTDILQQLGLGLQGVGQQLQPAVQGLGAITNPLAYQQQQENLRQQRQLQLQQQLRMTISPYEQSQLDLERQRMQNEADYRTQQINTENTHWQKMYEQQDLAHKQQVAEWQLANADKLQDAQPDDPGAVFINGKYQKMKLPSDTISVNGDMLKDLGTDDQGKPLFSLPDGATSVNMNLEKASPLMEQVRKNRMQKSMAGEAQSLGALIDQNYANNPLMGQIAHSRLNAAMSQPDPTGQRAIMDGLYKELQEWNQDKSPEAQQRKQAIVRAGQVDANKQEFINRNPYTPQEVVQGVKALQERGTKVLQGMNPRLQQAVREEFAKQGGDLINLTEREQQDRDRANTGLNLINQARQVLDQPGVRDQFGIVGSRWQQFRKGLGSTQSKEWQQIADKVNSAQGVAQLIHQGVRGGAATNPEVEKRFKFADAKTMDFPTFMQGLNDAEDLLRQYANEGASSQIATPQSQLGLRPALPPLPSLPKE